MNSAQPAAVNPRSSCSSRSNSPGRIGIRATCGYSVSDSPQSQGLPDRVPSVATGSSRPHWSLIRIACCPSRSSLSASGRLEFSAAKSPRPVAASRIRSPYSLAHPALSTFRRHHVWGLRCVDLTSGSSLASHPAGLSKYDRRQPSGIEPFRGYSTLFLEGVPSQQSSRLTWRESPAEPPLTRLRAWMRRYHPPEIPSTTERISSLTLAFVTTASVESREPRRAEPTVLRPAQGCRSALTGHVCCRSSTRSCSEIRARA